MIEHRQRVKSQITQPPHFGRSPTTSDSVTHRHSFLLTELLGQKMDAFSKFIHPLPQVGVLKRNFVSWTDGERRFPYHVERSPLLWRLKSRERLLSGSARSGSMCRIEHSSNRCCTCSVVRECVSLADAIAEEPSPVSWRRRKRSRRICRFHLFPLTVNET